MTRPTPRCAATRNPSFGAPALRVALAARTRPLGAMLLLTLLAACAGTPGPGMGVPVAQEAADYRAHAQNYYAPPGPKDDPWGPYIDEASRRFDVPDSWIRAVMHQESGGHEFINGQFVTSLPGAMGLMQLMPPTYDDMRSQYGLGPDAYDPHNNIMAGTAYIRQMYDIYGSPGFLAAYNTGPGRLDDFLTHNRSLPHETRQYVSIIGPQIAGIYPNSRSQADLMVMNHQISNGTLVAAAQSPSDTRSVHMAWARRRNHDTGIDQPVQVAEAPVSAPGAAPAYQTAWNAIPPARRAEAIAPQAAPSPATLPPASASPAMASTMVAANSSTVGSVWAARLAASPAPVVAAASSRPAPVQVASAAPVAHMREARHFRLIEPAMAESAPVMRGVAVAGPHDWAIQVGAFNTIGQANEAGGSARSRVHGLLPDAHVEIAGVHAGRSGARVYRARLTGLSRDDAMQACQRLSHGRSECMVVSPDSRS